MIRLLLLDHLLDNVHTLEDFSIRPRPSYFGSVQQRRKRSGLIEE